MTDAEKIRLHKTDRRTGKRIHYQNVAEDGRVVEDEDIVKGYEYEKGAFVTLEDEELSRLRVESTHMIDLVQFTGAEDIDPVYFERPFYVAPDGDIAMEAFMTLREALQATGKVALGQITIAGKERIAAIRPFGKGLMLETLRYGYEVRRSADIFKDIPKHFSGGAEQVDLARELIEKKSAPFDPDAFEDNYQRGLLDIIQAKLHHRKPKAPPREKPPEKVTDIVEALRRSLGQAEHHPAHRTARHTRHNHHGTA